VPRERSRREISNRPLERDFHRRVAGATSRRAAPRG